LAYLACAGRCECEGRRRRDAEEPPGPRAAAAALERELDAALAARRPCSCDGWLPPHAAAALPGCTTPFALAAAAAGAWLLFCVYYVALFGMLHGATPTATLLVAWLGSMVASYVFVQPLLVALGVLLFSAVLPAWLPYVRWLPLWGRLTGAERAHAHALGTARPLSIRLENVAYMEACGSANRLATGASLVSFGPFSTIAHVLGSAVGAPAPLRGGAAAAGAPAGGVAGEADGAAAAAEAEADSAAAVLGAHYLLEQVGCAVRRSGAPEGDAQREAGGGGLTLRALGGSGGRRGAGAPASPRSSARAAGARSPTPSIPTSRAAWSPNLQPMGSPKTPRSPRSNAKVAPEALW
jgi:hypothetical protein